MGSGLFKNPRRRDPDLESFFECLQQDVQTPDELGDFLEEFGYEDIEGFHVWKACRRAHKKLKKLLGADFQAFLELATEG